MPEASKENRIIARAAVTAFGGALPKVTCYYDKDEKSSVNILTSENSPRHGVTSYSTIGLSDSPLYRGDEEFEVRLELVGACMSGSCDFAAALSTAAFCIINSHWFCAPGIVFPDIWLPSDRGALRHLLFLPPSFWDDLKTIEFPTKTVAWLVAIPITQREMEFAVKNGPLRLEDIFEARQTDLFDFSRASTV